MRIADSVTMARTLGESESGVKGWCTRFEGVGGVGHRLDSSTMIGPKRCLALLALSAIAFAACSSDEGNPTGATTGGQGAAGAATGSGGASTSGTGAGDSTTGAGGATPAYDCRPTARGRDLTIAW